ncbi:hypothetical protein AAFC00_006520 [Neodothiora populina]|uniref:Zn(2)-C6 fungal-type domain-containing protein n=1 Tax=Neodothiora populina TaxID=2781224 RepID=A0ABR3PAG2_9PEZI
MSQMRGTASRRSNACWTCKLRRKKCDEDQPACTACVQRTITCHGYNPEKPSWMDGGQNQKAELDRIQHIVKENKRRQRRIQLQQQRPLTKRRTSHVASQLRSEVSQNSTSDLVVAESCREMMLSHGITNVEIDDLENHVHGHNSAAPSQVSPVAGSIKSYTPVNNQTNASIATPDTSGSGCSQLPRSTSQLRFNNAREAELLMHYLDQVFALQFRFHQPSVSAGGRGWLLWLLTETQPLYHAALSLGALHQHALNDNANRHDILVELNEHHTRALQEVQRFLQHEYDSSNTDTGDRGKKRNLQVLACGVQFISFELFRGGINVWEPHLKYLATSLSLTQGNSEVMSDHTPSSSTPMNRNISSSESLMDTAEHFLTGAVLWFDIIACASTGKGPLMKNKHERLLVSGQVNLANIIGCHAWVAVLIGEIAQIHQEAQEHTLSTWELVERGNPIRQRLMTGIGALREEVEHAFSTLGRTQLMLNTTARTEAVHRAVTLAFAHATQVYLNSTVMGAFPYTQEMQTSVKQAANALQEMQNVCDIQDARSLVWPICIAGSMAHDPTLQSFFRKTIVDLGRGAHDFGNSVTVLRIMERCWLYWRERSPSSSRIGYSWLSAMEENGQRVLLV